MPPALGVERSFSGRRWVLSDVNEDAVRALSRSANISPALSRLLVARGVSSDDTSKYLNPTLKDFLPEPFLLRDMEKAVARAARAIEAGESIAVFGDYDVDGSCSAALLNLFLSSVGRTPIVYIPDRLTEGYGPTREAFLKLKQRGVQLIITADCGATATDALTAARESGLDVIVLDHHAVEDPAEIAFAHVNPNQPDDTSVQTQLCAAGVVFLFLVALNRLLRESNWYASNGMTPPDLMACVDLVGLATVCDVVPLVGVNRAFVRAALARISKSPGPGLKALAELAKAEGPFTPYHLGYVFGPRINAGGRVGRCSLGVELLCAPTVPDAMPLATLLERHNRERQAIEAIIIEEASAQAGTQDNLPFLLVVGDGWHSGVVGIVAGRLKDRFEKPALAIGLEHGRGRGSARSVAGVDVGAMIRAARDRGLIENGGGHAMAAGFSLSTAQIDPFRAFLLEQFACGSPAANDTHALEIESLISIAGATATLVADIDRAGPFGAGNPEPLLVVPNARVAFADVVGRGHIRLRLEGTDGTRLGAIAFRAADTPLGEGLLKSRGGRIHIAGTLKSDRWNGKPQIQLVVRDAASAEG